VDDLADAIGRRSYGPLLLTPALIAIIPVVGALPGVSWLMAALATLISLQFVFLRRRVWLPDRLGAVKLPAEALHKGIDQSRPWIERADRWFKPRFEFILTPSSTWLIALTCLAVSASMFPFSLVPGGVLAPGLALAVLAFGLAAHDGIWILIGLALSAAALIFVVWFAL